jgi:small multidrug resistance pump
MPAPLTLASAILAEVCGTMALRASHGWTRVGPTVLAIVAYLLSFYALSLTLRSLDVGVVYAIWAAVGTALIATLGIAFLDEPLNAAKVACLTLIVAGVIGLSLQESL